MGELAHQVELKVIVNEAKQEGMPPGSQPISSEPLISNPRLDLNRWIRISAFSLFLLISQSVAVLLGRLYYAKGGKSKWLETVVQLIGFPALLPLYCILQVNTKPETRPKPNSPSTIKLVMVYVILGVLLALNTILYSIGLKYLPVSTYTIICASQLAFNAIFSFFLNGQKFTPFIINSLVLLTISSTLIACSSSGTDSIPKRKYAIGFICTLVASSVYALTLSLMQLAFQKVVKGKSFKSILDMLVYVSLVATLATLVGLFVSGEWRTLKGEMEGYALGRVSYVMTLLWTALLWQVYAVCIIGLILEVSSLFANVISTVGLPLTPVLAVIFLHDKMDGIKGVAMALAVWGFVSYTYQHYLDDYKAVKHEVSVDVDHVASNEHA